MISVLRFLRGYIDFAISGSLPETFLNTLTESGISVWNVKSREGVIYARTLALNYRYIVGSARKKNVRVRVIRKYGVPFFLHRNRKRIGIPIGSVCFLVIFAILSKFIWYVNIYGNENIPYSRAKSVLEELGVHEGAKAKFDSLRDLQNKALLRFGDLSWITINTEGSTAEAKMTETTKETTENPEKHYNITAKCGGQIIRADVEKGMPYVQSGDAVAQGSLLIGGFVQTELGSTILDTARGVILAKTEHTERISVPKRKTYRSYEDSLVTRRNAELFGLKMPLEMKSVRGDTEKIGFLTESSLDFKGKTAPINLISEHIFYFDTQTENVGEKLAEDMFNAERALLELFSYSDKKIIGREVSFSDDDDYYYYDIVYSCEEDIGQKEEIILDEDFSYDSSIEFGN